MYIHRFATFTGVRCSQSAYQTHAFAACVCLESSADTRWAPLAQFIFLLRFSSDEPELSWTCSGRPEMTEQGRESHSEKWSHALLRFRSSWVGAWRLLSSTGFWWRVDKTWRLIHPRGFCLWLGDCREFVGRLARMKILWHFGPNMLFQLFIFILFIYTVYMLYYKQRLSLRKFRGSILSSSCCL